MRERPDIGIIITDRNLNITYWNFWLEEKTGLSSEEVLGKSLIELVTEKDKEKFRNIFSEVLQFRTVRILSPKIHGYFIPIKLYYPSKYFEYMQQLVFISPLESEHDIVGLMITIEDVTKSLEEEYDLKEKLRNPSEKIRMEALRKLAEKDKREVVKALSDESWRVRRVAVEELQKSAKDMVIDLLKKMKEEYHNLNVLNSILKVASNIPYADIVDILSDMLKDKDPDLRIYTVQLLQNQKNPKIEDLLISALFDENPNVVFVAIEGLGKIRSQKAVPYLLDILDKRDFYLSIPVLEALKEIRDSSVLLKIYPLLEDEIFSPYVIEILGDVGDDYSAKILVDYLNKTINYSDKVVDSLGRIYKRYDEKLEGEYIIKIIKDNIKPEGIKNLINAISSIREEILKNIIPILGEIKDPVIERILLKLLGNPNLRSEILEVIIRRGENIIPILLEKLKEDDKELKMLAIIALGRIGNNSVVPYLLEVFEEEDDLTVVCAGALAKIGDKRAFEPLIKKLGHPDPYVRQAVISAINSLGHPELPQKLKELLRSENIYEKESAIKIAGYFGFEECKKEIFDLINDENEDIRRAVYENIVFFEDESVVDLLKEGLDKEKRKVREVIAKSLMYIEKEKALPLLRIALRDSSPWVRYYAVKSLLFHNPPDIFEILEDLLKREETNLVRIVIIDSLGELKNKKALPLLKSFLQTQDRDLLLATIRAIGKIKHPESISLLLPFLNSSDKSVRMETLRALGEQRDVAVISNIVWKIATEEDQEVVLEGLKSLLKIGTLESIKSILSLGLDSNKRELCIEVISLIPEEFISPLLREAKYMSPIARANLILALERRKIEATKYISEFLGDEDKSVRLQAVLSLINIGSYEAKKILRDYMDKEEDQEIRDLLVKTLEMKDS